MVYSSSMAKDIDAKIDDLAAMVAQGFSELRTDMTEGFAEVNGRIDRIEDTMATKADVERFVHTVRTDYDALAARVKDIEKSVAP